MCVCTLCLCECVLTDFMLSHHTGNSGGQGLYVFHLSVCLSFHICRNFFKFGTTVHFESRINWWDFGSQRLLWRHRKGIDTPGLLNFSQMSHRINDDLMMFYIQKVKSKLSSHFSTPELRNERLWQYFTQSLVPTLKLWWTCSLFIVIQSAFLFRSLNWHNNNVYSIIPLPTHWLCLYCTFNSTSL